ncbi:MAG: hypothetical protein HC769_08945 [Cyanobacteria bacterium CRU_2_1]|nr:hypothetical protein [Cyanobacteria bacterium RU_5_0]NJR58962.1 hypothetical protein [Cyanobacteria bacterium CRU_2_1]
MGKWIIASVISWAVSWVVGLTVGVVITALAAAMFNFYEDSSMFLTVFGTVFGIIAGTIVGLAQWFLLRRKTSGMGRWLLVSSVGIFVGIASCAIVTGAGMPGSALGIVVFGVVYGIVTGKALFWFLQQSN